ncbi:DUF5628 domain-containing protein [Mycobacterium sp. MYCO198283]|uniref:PAS domain-containing protein n=1 Tax=Mycobacterium sp. MYCO198283 TaxID=2883505 RepID=UPI001E448186|nr:PAS domain-containing protein [Mycobacterium sp. MYCO198283]MCG5432795.1 DUF5628 domain-containing protein [Mycobacterium sp. MYCO198283]
MRHDWLLVETLGEEPVVVAVGRQQKNMVPVNAFLRRSPLLSSVNAAIADTIRHGQGLSSAAPKKDRVIRTEPVQMSDGRVHGVHVWAGPAGAEVPERPVPGPLIWDMTSGVATDTPESLRNSGMNPDDEVTHGRAFAEDLPRRDLNPSETRVLSMAITSRPGDALCTTWDITGRDGELITVGFVARVGTEIVAGSEHLIARAMNWRSERPNPVVAPDHLAQRILDGLAQPGVYRALVDLRSWTLLKWLDDPCPYYDWRAARRFHPDDEGQFATMATEFARGPTSRVLRLPGVDGGWVSLHVTINRVELEPGVVAGLIALRLPTPSERNDPQLVGPAS